MKKTCPSSSTSGVFCGFERAHWLASWCLRYMRAISYDLSNCVSNFVKRKDIRIDRQTDRQTSRQTDTQTNKTDRHTDKQPDRQDRQTRRHTDRTTNRQTNKADRHKDTETHEFRVCVCTRSEKNQKACRRSHSLESLRLAWRPRRGPTRRSQSGANQHQICNRAAKPGNCGFKASKQA